MALARAGAEVILAGRNPQKGADAVRKIREELSSAAVRFEQVDLANLNSVAAFAGRLQRERASLDLLLNNAGVMVPPRRQETADGFELQLGTNYLGHFALTAGLLPLLRRGAAPRVVTVSSIAARDAVIDFDDPNATNYDAMRAYSQSKLACLMFSFELQRRSNDNGWGISSIAAHPGVSRTDLLHNAPGRWSAMGMARSMLWFMFQPPAQGAWPSLFAATSPDARGGAYYGPNKLKETRGFPTLAQVPERAADQASAQRLWRLSEQLTGYSFRGDATPDA